MIMAGSMIVSLAAISSTAKADPKDYRFEAVQPQITVSPNSAVAVRLIHIPTGKPVTDAILFQPKMEMLMGNMQMATRITPAAPDGKGLYPFVADIGMTGAWTLTVSAKAQGESATLTGSVPFSAVDVDHGAMGGRMDHGHTH